MVLLVAHPRLSHFPGIIRFSYIFKRSDFNFGFKNYTAWLHVCNPLSKQNKLVVKSGKYQRWKQRCCSLCWELADGLEKLWRNKLFCDEFWSVRLKYRNAIEDCTPSCPQNHMRGSWRGVPNPSSQPKFGPNPSSQANFCQNPSYRFAAECSIPQLFTTVFSNSFGLQFKSNKSLEFSVCIMALQYLPAYKNLFFQI